MVFIKCYHRVFSKQCLRVITTCIAPPFFAILEIDVTLELASQVMLDPSAMCTAPPTSTALLLLNITLVAFAIIILEFNCTHMAPPYLALLFINVTVDSLHINLQLNRQCIAPPISPL